MTVTSARPLTKRVGLAEQFIALAEVTLLLASAHVACKSFKQFTELGRQEVAAKLNFSPGWTMAMFAIGLLIILRRDFGTYGLDVRVWPMELKRAIEMAAAKSRISPRWWWTAIGLQFVVCIVAGLFRLSVTQLLLLVTWQLFATALGEEIFFRGYMQSRLSQVFVRRFSILRIRCGFGLIITALLFGLLHSFNTVDYFSGRFTFAWTLAFLTALMGFAFGLLKEGTGSIVPGIIVHALNNLFWLMVMPHSAWFWLSRPSH
ncbi:MAG: CPBP family intramembrane glutamic endopeptidase [Opitutaceae bacterium]